MDPAIERVRHYVGCEETSRDLELRPSPTLLPVPDEEWPSDDDEYSSLESTFSVFSSSFWSNARFREGIILLRASLSRAI